MKGRGQLLTGSVSEGERTTTDGDKLVREREDNYWIGSVSEGERITTDRDRLVKERG